MDDDTRRADQERREASLPPWDARTELYAGGISSSRFADLPVATRLGALARAWLAELRRVGLSAGRKTEQKTDYPLDYREGPTTFPARLENGETLWLQIGGYPAASGYPRATVLETAPRTDMAILAALAVLESGEGDPTRIRRALTPERDKERERYTYGSLELSDERLLLCADNLLLHHRTEFRAMPEAEQMELRVKACERIVAAADAARRLHEFLEFGKAEGRTRHGIENARRDVLAAELHHFDGMSQRQIAAELNRDVSERLKIKGGDDTVSLMIARGTSLFIGAFGQQGWERYKRVMHEAHQQGADAPDS